MEFSSLLLSVTLLHFIKCQEPGVILSFYAQDQNNIREGNNVAFICQVSPEFDDGTNTLFLSKKMDSGGTSVLATQADTGDETKSVQWSDRILTVTLFNVDRYASGDYICFASSSGISGENILDIHNTTIDVLYPASGSPVCKTSPASDGAKWYDGDEITLQCSSDSGNPEVILSWSNNKGVAIPNANTQVVTDSLESYVAVTIDSLHDGVTFTCLRENPTFPSNQQRCTIGPLIVEEERPTTLLRKISHVTSSIIPPTAESWSTAAMTMESKSATSTYEIGVIVAIVVVFIIVIGIVIIIVVFLVRSGRYASILKSNKDDSRTENISLESGYNNGKVVVQDNSHHGHDNPAVDANHVLSPNGGQLYAVVQKNTPARETSASGDTSIVYPTAPEYPRPAKTRQSDGDLYANAGIARDEASGESPDNPNRYSATRKEDTAGISSEKSNDGDASGMALYANPSDIATGDSADASLIGTTRKQDDSEMALYANASVVIPDDSHMPAPSEAPPAPPAMAHTPGLEYADIDIARPASLGADGRVDIISNEDQVLYASVK